MSFLLNPFVFAGAAGDFESIATVTVGSGGASSIEFTSIPGTYQHLQMRGVLRGTTASNDVESLIRVNGVSAANSYSRHQLYGNGASAAASGGANATSMWAVLTAAASATASIFGALQVTFLDYASTSKNKTMLVFAGHDRNGAGYALLRSGCRLSTDAITSITVLPNSDNFAEYSSLALYGIRA